MKYKLKVIVPGASKGIHQYLNSKFSAIWSKDEWEDDGYGSQRPKVIGRIIPKIMNRYPDSRDNKFKSNAFRRYFINATKCEFQGHLPIPCKHAGHLPRCKNCNNLVTGV